MIKQNTPNKPDYAEKAFKHGCGTGAPRKQRQRLSQELEAREPTNAGTVGTDKDSRSERTQTEEK